MSSWSLCIECSHKIHRNNPPPAFPPVLRPAAWSLSRDVGCRGTWSHPLQRLQHPLPFVERPGPQERKGQAGVPETVLWGGLARHWERKRSCWSDVYIQSLQEGQNYAPENKFQPARTQQWGMVHVFCAALPPPSYFRFFMTKWNGFMIGPTTVSHTDKTKW